jgi:hypothetical protein
LEVSPSSPTQKLEYVAVAPQLAVGCVQFAETVVKREPVAAYPDQFELVLCEILWFGANSGPGAAVASAGTASADARTHSAESTNR